MREGEERGLNKKKNPKERSCSEEEGRRSSKKEGRRRRSSEKEGSRRRS